MKKEKLIILGSGPAGLTAAIYSAREGLEPVVIDGYNPGGQLMQTSIVENWPGDIAIDGPALMFRMRDHAKHFGTRFIDSSVKEVDLQKRPFTIKTKNNKEFKSDTIIIATGATYKKLNIPGEQKYFAKGVSNCSTCDGPLYKRKTAVIIGGGDTAMENASLMTNFTDKITIVHILDKFTASKAMIDPVLKSKKINIIYESTAIEIIGNGEIVTEVVIKNQKTNTTKTLDADIIFVSIGLVPNTKFLGDQVELEKSGHIKVTNYTRCSVEGVFIAGDVSDPRYRQAVTSAGAGCMAALDAEKYLKKII